MLGDQKHRQSEFIQDSLHMFLAKLASASLTKGRGDEAKRRVEGLGAHKLGLFRKQNLEVCGAELCGVVLVELAEERVEAALVGEDARVARSILQRVNHVSEVNITQHRHKRQTSIHRCCHSNCDFELETNGLTFRRV